MGHTKVRCRQPSPDAANPVEGQGEYGGDHAMESSEDFKGTSSFENPIAETAWVGGGDNGNW